MKKLILLALTAVIMAGCVEVKSKQYNKIKNLDIYNGVYYTPNGCEYYIYHNYHSGIPIHKEDCKRCAERKMAELEKLIKRIKE